MKKIILLIIVIVAVVLPVFLFTGCGPSIPSDFPQRPWGNHIEVSEFRVNLRTGYTAGVADLCEERYGTMRITMRPFRGVHNNVPFGGTHAAHTFSGTNFDIVTSEFEFDGDKIFRQVIFGATGNILREFRHEYIDGTTYTVFAEVDGRNYIWTATKNNAFYKSGTIRLPSGVSFTSMHEYAGVRGLAQFSYNTQLGITYRQPVWQENAAVQINAQLTSATNILQVSLDGENERSVQAYHVQFNKTETFPARAIPRSAWYSRAVRPAGTYNDAGTYVPAAWVHDNDRVPVLSTCNCEPEKNCGYARLILIGFDEYYGNGNYLQFRLTSFTNVSIPTT
jgi:hypothetical protein